MCTTPAYRAKGTLSKRRENVLRSAKRKEISRTRSIEINRSVKDTRGRRWEAQGRYRWGRLYKYMYLCLGHSQHGHVRGFDFTKQSTQQDGYILQCHIRALTEDTIGINRKVDIIDKTTVSFGNNNPEKIIKSSPFVIFSCKKDHSSTFYLRIYPSNTCDWQYYPGS